MVWWEFFYYFPDTKWANFQKFPIKWSFVTNPQTIISAFIVVKSGIFFWQCLSRSSIWLNLKIGTLRAKDKKKCPQFTSMRICPCPALTTCFTPYRADCAILLVQYCISYFPDQNRIVSMCSRISSKVCAKLSVQRALSNYK